MQDRQVERGGLKWGVRAVVGLLWILIFLISLSACELPSAVDDSGGDQVTSAPTESQTEAAALTENVAGTEAPTETETPAETVTLTAAPEATLGVGSSKLNEPDGAALVYVPAGEFLMGSEHLLAFDNEAPEHTVTLDAYWIYQFEVTNAQYRACIADGICQGELINFLENDLPAINVTWFEADQYCTGTGGRLPTEAEWEKAARGTDDRLYPWGDEPPNCDLVYYEKCGTGKVPVGSLPDGASPYDAMDMAGNAWEWTADWYQFDFYDFTTNDNPTGPATGEKRVVRGVSWFPTERCMRVSFRWSYFPENSYSTIGFRCVVDP